MRNTQQKDAIRSAFEQANRPLSPDEVLALANKKVKRLSIATVYRNINTLVEDAFLSTVEVPGEPSRYEIAGKGHHHHFQCDDCGKIFELEGCLVQDRPRLPRGVRITRHEILLYGLFAASA